MKNILVACSFIFALLLSGCDKETVQPKTAKVTSNENLLPRATGINLYTYAVTPTSYYNVDSKVAVYDITGHTVDIFNPSYPPENGVILDKNTGARISAVKLAVTWNYSNLHPAEKRYLVYAKSVENGKYGYIYFTLPVAKTAEINLDYQWETKYSKPTVYFN